MTWSYRTYLKGKVAVFENIQRHAGEGELSILVINEQNNPFVVCRGLGLSAGRGHVCSRNATKNIYRVIIIKFNLFFSLKKTIY